MSFSYDNVPTGPASSGSNSSQQKQHQFLPQQQQQQQQQPQQQPQQQQQHQPQFPSADSKTNTLWMGELEPWFDEAAISKIWLNYGEIVNVKLIRDKFSSANNAGYCFVEFASSDAAAKALNLHGTPMPGSNKTFKLNWAAGSNPGGVAVKKEERDYSIFVGDLASDVVESALLQLFQSRYRSCKSVKIMADPATNLSKGYGFVRFADEADMQHALTEMQGFYFNGRPLRISNAVPKSRLGGANTNMGGAGAMMQSGAGMMHSGFPQQGHGGPGGPGPMMYNPQMGMPPVGYFGAPQSMNQFTDPNNTTVFVGGLSSNVTEDELRLFFTSFGEITYVKIPPGKGCGFVQFVQRHSAEQAITQMQGYPIGNSRVRLSWGRSQNQNGLANAPYRANPPPPVYPQMGMPPQPHYGPYAPINPHAAHVHPTPQPGQMIPPQIGIPPQAGAQVAPGQDPSEPIPVARLNELYLAAKDGRLDRMESDSNGFHDVYTQ